MSELGRDRQIEDGEASLLKLLLEDADASRLSEPLAALRSTGEDSPEVARLRQATIDALRLRANLDDYRSRTRDFNGLLEAVKNLPRIREVQHVLQDVVRGARELLQVDLTILLLIDESGTELRMRISDGTLSEMFRKVRLQLGEGVAGLCAQLGEPVCTPNYLSGEAFAHTEYCDAVVRDEGIEALLAVPLRLGQRIPGVLLAGHRAPRRFKPEDISLLTSFAGIAAVALDNARLFDDMTKAVSDLNAANAALREHSLAVERASSAHALLVAAVLEGRDLTWVSEQVAEALDVSVLVLGADGHAVAHTNGAFDDVFATRDNAGRKSKRSTADEAIGKAMQSGVTVEFDADVIGRCRAVTPVVAAGEYLGCVVIDGPAPMTDSTIRVLEQLSHAISVLLLNRRSADESRRRLGVEIVNELLTSNDDDERSALESVRRLGFDPMQPCTVVVAQAPAQARQMVLHRAGSVLAESSGYVGVHGGMITVLLPGFSPAQARDEVAKLRATLPTNVAVSAGIAGPVQGVKCLAKAYRDARRFCEALIALDRAGQTASLEDLGMYGLLISASSSVWAAETAARLLGDLVRYDQEHNTDLLTTVERYVNSRTAKEAADDLYVHINTLYQRLQRASTILNRDLFDPRQRLEVQLALGINRFLGSRHSEAS